MKVTVERYIGMYSETDISENGNFDSVVHKPNLVRNDFDQVLYGNNREEMKEHVLSDARFYIKHRPYPNECVLDEGKDTVIVTDPFQTCIWVIKKIAIELTIDPQIK